MDKNISDVIEFFETTSQDEANEYIKCGWEPRDTYTTCYDTEGPMIKHQTMHYCLMWRKDKGDIVKPEPAQPMDLPGIKRF